MPYATLTLWLCDRAASCGGPRRRGTAEGSSLPHPPGSTRPTAQDRKTTTNRVQTSSCNLNPSSHHKTTEMTLAARAAAAGKRQLRIERLPGGVGVSTVALARVSRSGLIVLDESASGVHEAIFRAGLKLAWTAFIRISHISAAFFSASIAARTSLSLRRRRTSPRSVDS